MPGLSNKIIETHAVTTIAQENLLVRTTVSIPDSQTKTKELSTNASKCIHICRPEFDDEDSLRKAGRYGKQLLDLLHKETVRADELEKLLEHERQKLSGLINHETTINRLKRKNAYQEKHLKLLEEQCEKMEEMAEKCKEEVESERTRRLKFEAEVKQLKEEVERLENIDNIEITEEETKIANIHRSTAKIAGLANDQQLQPRTNSSVQTDELNHKDQRICFEEVIKGQINTLKHIRDLNASIAAHIQIGAKKSYMPAKLLDDEIYILSKVCNMNSTLANLSQDTCKAEKPKEMTDKMNSTTAREVSSAHKKRRLCVLTCREENESFISYIIQVENSKSDCFYRMVQTRYRHFGKIYRWVIQNANEGLLTKPDKPPSKIHLFSNISERKAWLHSTLRKVEEEQPLLLDVLLDYIGMLSRNSCRHRY